MSPPAIPKVQEPTTAGQLALEVMHEIKNPLEALGHLTYLALEEADEPEKVRKYMRLAEEQMAALNQIVRQTLGFARSTQRTQSSNLADLAEAALRLHNRRIQSQKVRLSKRVPADLIADIYPGELLQVVSNLIANALDVLAEDGILHLRFSRTGDEVHLIIADNGPGIAEEHLERIFEPFFTTKEERGTGLGLALSRRIVQHHNGRIRVRSSVRPGRSGTAFRISIPAAPALPSSPTQIAS